MAELDSPERCDMQTGDRDALAAADAHEPRVLPAVMTEQGSTTASQAGPWGRWVPLALAVLMPGLLFFGLPPLASVGLLEPHELSAVDLARRIALHLHGASDFALEGADNSLPHLNDLGRPQLAFTSMALGLRVLGLHDWAGRMPLALWGVIGVVVTYGWVARLVDKRAGVFAAAALCTMPAYFVGARTMLGDIVTMAAFSMAFGGLLVAAIDAPNPPDASNQKECNVHDSGRPRSRVMWLALGVLGLVCGYFSRGALLGVAVPSLSVGIAVFASRGVGGASADRLARGVASVATCLGIYAVLRAIIALEQPIPADLSPWIGAMLRPPGKYPTFDATLGQLACALAPWSAWIPFAVARLFVAPALALESGPARFTRESETRLALLLALGMAFVAHGWLAAKTDLIVFSAPAVLAAACAIALRDLERGAHASVAVGVGTLATAAVIHHEFRMAPEKAFYAFGTLGATFPQSFNDRAIALWTAGLVGFGALAFITFVETSSDRMPFSPRRYLSTLLTLRDAWDGMLSLVYFAIVAGSSFAGLAVWFGSRYRMAWVAANSRLADLVVNAWWIAALVPLAVVFGAMFWCDVWLWAFGRARPFGRASVFRGWEPFKHLWDELRTRRLVSAIAAFARGTLDVSESSPGDGVGLVALFVVAPLMVVQIPAIVLVALLRRNVPIAASLAIALPSGVALFVGLGVLGDALRGSRAAAMAVGASVLSAGVCVGFFPVLANQLSPKEVFETYERVHAKGEPIGLVGFSGRAAAYYAGAQPATLNTTEEAVQWLAAGSRDGDAQRRFLAVRSEQLPRMNRAYRMQFASHQNLPVLDSRSSQVVLATSFLKSGEVSRSPFDAMVVPEFPAPQQVVRANLDDTFEVVGYEITDDAGQRLDAVSAGKKVHLRTYLRVIATPSTEWEMFVHIDGYKRRHNGDHSVCNGKYPMANWLPGDNVIDDYEFALAPTFTAGSYTVYMGLFAGERRIKVKTGASDGENRVVGGMVRVR